MAHPSAEASTTAGTIYRSSRSIPVDHNSYLTALLRGIADRDRGAFATLYATLAPALWREVVDRGFSTADADAVLATTFVEVWQMASSHVDDDTRVVDWIHRSVGRRCAERRHRMRESAPDAGPGGGETTWWRQNAVRYEESAKRAVQELLGGAPAGRELTGPAPPRRPPDDRPSARVSVPVPATAEGDPPPTHRPRRVDLGAASAFGHRRAGAGPAGRTAG